MRLILYKNHHLLITNDLKILEKETLKELDVKIENTREGLTKKLQAKYPGCVVVIEDKKYQAKNMKTGEVITCKTIGELCSKLGDDFKKSTIRTYIACNKTHNGYMFRESPFPYTDVWVQGEDSKEADNYMRPIICVDTRTGDKQIFNSTRLAAKKFYVTRNVIRSCVESGSLLNNVFSLTEMPY